MLEGKACKDQGDREDERVWEQLVGDVVAEARVHLGAFVISLGGKTVRFDNFSHTSGNRRGYIPCCVNKEHHECYKYRFVREFPSHRHCAAWLMAWDSKPQTFATKDKKLDFKPGDVAVARVLAPLP